MRSNNNPLVSVIIPAYNHGQFVQETILSIVAQTYKNIELIVIDDGSKDDTWNKINELKDICEKRFARIHFKTKENEGTCKTLNRLISLTNGEFVYFIASDDMAKPQAIEKLLENMKISKAIVAVGNNEIINHKGECIGWDDERNSCDFKTAKYKTFGEFLRLENKKETFGTYEELIKANHIPNGYLIIKKALLQIPKFTADAPLEDYFMHLQLAKIGKYCFVDEILLSYRWHKDNTAKQVDYMCEITYKTKLYEKNIVASLKDKKWQHVFEKNTNKIKMKFNFFNFIKFYTVKNIVGKLKILEIFGREFVLRNIKWHRKTNYKK